MKDIKVGIRVIYSDTKKRSLMTSVAITKEEIEQLACNKAREEYPEVQGIYADGSMSINLI